MAFPMVDGLKSQTTNYMVCYMTRASGASDTANWQKLGTIGVFSPDIAFTAETQPYKASVLEIRFITGRTVMLDTLPQGDAAKQTINSPCYGTEWAPTERPYGVLSWHVGQETNAQQLGIRTNNNVLLETDIDDLGDPILASVDFHAWG